MPYTFITKIALGLAISSPCALSQANNAYAANSISVNSTHIYTVQSNSQLTPQRSGANLQLTRSVLFNSTPQSTVSLPKKPTMINSIVHLAKSFFKGISTIGNSITHAITHFGSFIHQSLKPVGSAISQLAHGAAQIIETVTGTIDGFLHIGPPLLLGNFPGGNALSSIATNIGTAIATAGEDIAQKITAIGNEFSQNFTELSIGNSSSIRDSISTVPSINLQATPVISASVSPHPASIKATTILPSDQNLIRPQITPPNVSLLQ